MAALTERLPLFARPTRKVPAVIVFNSALVRPSIPAASAPPRLTDWPAVFDCRVAIAPVAVVVPVRAMLSAV